MLYQGLCRWLSRPRARLHLAALVFALSLPAIAMGMVGDDYDLEVAVRRDPLGAYRFTSPDASGRARQILAGQRAGTRPWWMSPDHRQAFLRPLASLSHALDFGLWPDAAWWMHVENSLLYAAIVLLAWALFRDVGMPPAAVGLAAFFYAFNGNQSMTVGWISGRNTLLAACLGWLSVWLHLRARRGASPSTSWAAAVCFGLALLSAEGALGALAFIVAHALVLEQGGWRARGAALWPYAAVLVAWRVAYSVGGYGVVGSAFYRDPMADPLGFALGAAGAIPIYLASQLTLPFASMSGVEPGSFAVVLLLSLVLLGLLAPLLRPVLRDRPQARFLGLGALLATLPLGATLPQDRLVFFIGLGTSGLVALVVHDRLSRPRPGAGRRGARALLTLHGLVMPLLFVPVLFSSMNQFLGGGALALDRALPRRSDVHVVLLNGPSHLPVHFARLMRMRRGETGIPVVDTLYAGGGDATLTRVSEDVLELHVPRGWLATRIEGTVRDVAREPFAAGQILELPRMVVEVLEVDGRGAPTRVRFELRSDALERRFYSWSGREPQPQQLPAVGGRIRLPGISPI
ncbi:MAG: hypothetical protein PVI30_24190 [Myxococcales bacterium]